MNHDRADAIAAKALHHIAADAALLARFLDTSGLAPEDFGEAAGTAEFWAATLSFLRQDEAECLVFASNAGLTPEDMERAAAILEGRPSRTGP